MDNNTNETAKDTTMAEGTSKKGNQDSKKVVRAIKGGNPNDRAEEEAPDCRQRMGGRRVQRRISEG